MRISVVASLLCDLVSEGIRALGNASGILLELEATGAEQRNEKDDKLVSPRLVEANRDEASVVADVDAYVCVWRKADLAEPEGNADRNMIARLMVVIQNSYELLQGLSRLRCELLSVASSRKLRILYRWRSISISDVARSDHNDLTKPRKSLCKS